MLKGAKMKLLQSYLENLNIKDPTMMDKFLSYFDLLIFWNKKFNLTAITDKDAIEIKHFIDSLAGTVLIARDSTICDIGSGAGFPSIPLSIIRPDCEFYLVDSLAKRVSFLNEVIKQLGLTNCEAIHARAEDFSSAHKNTYDYCVARAVAPMPTLIEYTLPLLKVGGKLLAYKGSNVNEEIDLSTKALSCLYGKIEKIHHFNLPNDDYRCIVEVVKWAKCPPCYPRSGNKPRLKPL